MPQLKKDQEDTSNQKGTEDNGGTSKEHPFDDLVEDKSENGCRDKGRDDPFENFKVYQQRPPVQNYNRQDSPELDSNLKAFLEVCLFEMKEVAGEYEVAC